MSDSGWTWSLEESFPSAPGAGKRVLDQVLEQLEASEWEPQEVFGVNMALEEALVNAIKHGNRNDETKRVRVSARLSPQQLWVRIEDDGPGFDPATVPDPTSPENLDRPSGRGLMLMRAFMSRVDFNQRGNCVILEKDRVAV